MFLYTMWILVHPTHLVLSSTTLSNEIFCSSFWSKIVWSKIHTLFHYLNIPPGRLEHRIDSLSSLGHITYEWEASSSQTTIIPDVIAVYPCFPKLLIWSCMCYAITAWLESLLVQYHQLLVIFTIYDYTLVHTIMTGKTGLQQEQTHAEVLDVLAVDRWESCYSFEMYAWRWGAHTYNQGVYAYITSYSGKQH